jgi:hypothetical protein
MTGPNLAILALVLSKYEAEVDGSVVFFFFKFEVHRDILNETAHCLIDQKWSIHVYLNVELKATARGFSSHVEASD